MPLDGFLELIRDGERIAGESQDAVFAKKKAISILNFEIDTSAAEAPTPDLSVSEEQEDFGESYEESSRSSLSSAPRTTAVPTGEVDQESKCPITFKISKTIDASSPHLYLSYCQHTDQEVFNDLPFDTAKVTLRKAAGKNPLVFLVIEFTKAYVTSYQLKSETETLPSEEISFTCRSMKMQYRPQRAGGGFGPSNIKGWDFDIRGDIVE